MADAWFSVCVIVGVLLSDPRIWELLGEGVHVAMGRVIWKTAAMVVAVDRGQRVEISSGLPKAVFGVSMVVVD